MATSTFTPALDGIVGGGSNTSWALARSASGSSSGYTFNSQVLLGRASNNTGEATTYWIWRGVLVFDTSSLPDDAIISSARLRLYVQSKTSGAGGSACLVGATPASDSALANSDFGNVGSTELASNRLTYSSLTTSAFNDFTLNASGIAAISLTGKTRFGVRPSQDLDNSSPSNATFSDAVCSTDNNASSGQWPILEVTYTSGRTTSDAWAWSDSLARTSTRSRATSDAWAWSDVVRRSFQRTTSDAWAWSDGASRLVRRGGISSIYSSSGDGIVGGGSNSSWALARAASPGNTAASGSTGPAYAFGYSSVSAGDAFTYYLYRAFYAFDLTSLPANTTIQSATLQIYSSGTEYHGGGGTTANNSACLVAGTQASTSTLATSDFPSRGTTELASRLSYQTDLASAGYKTFTLNAAGVAELNAALGGSAKFAVTTGYDLDNVAPTSTGYSGGLGYFSEQTGTSNDPVLSVAWTYNDLREPSADVWAWSDTAEATRTHSGQVTSGRASNDAWAWSDSVSIYGRLRATVTVVPEGANTTLTSYQNPYAGTIAVASTSGFPSSGSAYIIDTTNVLGHYPQAKFEYTSIDATHFYGCTSSSAEFNQTFAYGTSVGTLTNESHFPQIQALDSTSTPELLLTYHQHAAHSAANGTVRGRRSTDGGITWGEEFVIAEAVGRPGGVTGRRPGIYGHTLFQMANGTLFLAWYEHKIDNEDVETYTKYSTDNGVTWSTPIKVPNQYVSSNLMGQSTGCGIIEYGGYLYVMVYGWDGTNYNDRSPDDSYVQLLKTNDLGVTWTNVATVAKGGYNSAPVRGYNETSLVILPDGTWLAQIRAEINSGAGFSSLDRYQSVSTDNGVTWSTPTRVIQKFANTPIVWRMPDGTLLSQGMNQDAGRSVGTGYPITFFTADYNSWPAANYRAESVDATYIALNGSDFANTTTTPATALRATVNAYAVERVSQAGAQVKFQWYNIPGFYLSADAWAWSDSVTRTQTYGRTTSDAWAWNDRQAQTRTTADSWAWNDACATVKTQTKTASDAWAWTDAATRTAPRFRSLTEFWAWSDTATGVRVTPSASSDAWAWTDAATRVLNAQPVTYTRTAADAWAWLDVATETHGVFPYPCAVFASHYAYQDTNGWHYAYPKVTGKHYPYPKVTGKHGPTEGA